MKNAFPTPARLTAGTLYHIVFENVHADPESNYISVNNVLSWNSTRQPSISPEDGRRAVEIALKIVGKA